MKKKIFTFMTLLLGVVSGAWATEASFSLVSYTVTNGTYSTTTTDGITLLLSKSNGNIGGPADKDRGFRWQSNMSISITLPSSQKINTVQMISATSNNSGGNGNNLSDLKYSLTDGNSTLSGSWDKALTGKQASYTWTSTSGTNYQTWVLTNTGSNGDIYINTIVITYEEASTTNTAPVIVTQPATTLEAYVGYEASLTVGATGYPNPSYQWYSNSTNSNKGGTAIEGATSATYTFTPEATGTYYYYAVAFNTYDNATHTAVSSVSTVTVGLKYKVQWSAGETGATVANTLPDVDYPGGSSISLPTNNYFYIEGSSVSKWSNGNNEFAFGAAYTVNENVTFLPVFAENTKALGDEETTITWTFARENGAPNYAIEGNGKTESVIGTTANGIDLKMDVELTQSDDGYGKFNNLSYTNCAQVNKYSTFTIPALSGMIVKYTTTNGTLSTNDELLFGSEKATSIDGKNYVYEYIGSDATLTITDNVGGRYPSGISVTYPLISTTPPDTPTFPTETEVSGGSTVTLTGNAVTIYYQWKDSETALTPDSEGWTAGTSVAVPNEAGTKFLYAYASNGESLNSDVVSQAFSITKTATVVTNNWDFTAWSSDTQTGLIADTEAWNQYEKAGSSGLNFESNGRSNINSLSNNTLKYGTTTISETDGLKFTAGAYGLGLIFNLPSTTIGTYKGGSYLWLYGSNSKITIPDVPAGAIIAIGVESHKDSEARGVTVSNATQTKGEATAMAYQDCEWTVNTAGDVTITPTKGLHIYYIKLSTSAPVVETTLASSGISSFSSAKALDFSNVEGLNAYVVTGITATSVSLSSVEQAPEETGLILSGTGSESYAIPVATDAVDAIITNKLHAAVERTAVDANSTWVINGGQFKLYEGTYIPAGKSYLLASDVPEPAASLRVLFDESDVTGIEAVNTDRSLLNGQFFDLQGRAVAAPQKGLYIVNGKKIVVK